MNKHASRVVPFLLLLLAGTALAESRIVAVPEFQNKSDRILQISRWDLAVWTANDLKKTGEFQPVDRKKVNEVVKHAVWVDERMKVADEEKLRGLSASYVVYGTVVKWDTSNMGSQHESLRSTNFKAVSPAVVVAFSFDLVDLSTGKVVKNIVVDASAVGSDENFDSTKQPYPPDDPRFEQLFEDASKKAIRNATQKLAEFIQTLH